MKKLLLFVALLMVACDKDSPTAPTPATINVFQPLCCNEYFIGENIRIQWDINGPVAPVSINLISADSFNAPQFRIFTKITKNEVLFRDWWEWSSVGNGPYMFVVFYEQAPGGIQAEGRSNVFHLRRAER